MKKLSLYMLGCCLGMVSVTSAKECCNPAFTKRGVHLYKDYVKHEIIESQVAPGWGTIAVADGKVYKNFQGYRDIDYYNNGQNPIPMTEDTILRIASQSKFITAVGFLSLADKGYVSLQDNVSDYLPDFANTKVIEPCCPYSFEKLGTNPLFTTAGSADVVVTDLDHGLKTGDFIIISQDLPFQVNGVPESLLESLFPVTVIDPDHYKITSLFSVPAQATGYAGGDALNVAPLAANGSYKLGTNPLSTTNGSSTITVAHPGHSFVVGDVIALQLSSALNGIPAAELNNVHTITSTAANSYTFAVTTAANATSSGGGALIREFFLCFGAKQTKYHNATFYYKEIPLTSPLKVHHLLSHTSGHSYTTLGGFGASGLDPNVIAIYNGVAITSGPSNTAIPEGFPDPSLPLSATNLQTWASYYAKVPLMFQPGSQWTYGPQLAVVGALIERIDPQGRDLEQFLQDEVFDPIGMTDTGFFIQGGPGNPEWDDKVPRFAVVYDNSFAPVVPFIPIDSVVPAQHAPIAASLGWIQLYNYAGPRALPLGDGGMYSTLKDYVKFLRIFLNNGKTRNGTVILSPAMIATLSRNHIDDLDILGVARLFLPAGQEVKQAKWGLGVGLGQGINRDTLGVSRKQIAWGGALRTEYFADMTNQAIVQVGTNMLDLSANATVGRALGLSESVLLNALDKVCTFDEQLYTPGTASPYNFNDYVTPAKGQ